MPHYLLDRETQQRAKVLSNMVKQKRKEKAGKWDVPLPKGDCLHFFRTFSISSSPRPGRGRSVQNAEEWQAAEEGVEAHGDKSVLRAD